MSGRTIIVLLSIVGFSFILVIILQALSKNNFSTFLDFPRVLRSDFVEQRHTFDLTHRHYFAGATTQEIFFGNPRDPFDLLVTDSALGAPRHIRLSVVGGENLELTGSRIEIDSPFFYIKAGNLPGIFKGALGQWEALLTSDSITFFTQAVPITPNSFVFVPGNNTRKTDNQYRLRKSSGTAQVKLEPEFFDAQADTLSAMGMLRYSKELDCVVYVYYYRDEYMVMDSELNVLYRTSTIDTVNQGHIKPMEYINPELVNTNAEIYKGFLFLGSTLVARNESPLLRDSVAVVDVFDIKNNIYLFSFYLPDYEGIRVQSFKIIKDRIVAIYDQHAVIYAFKEHHPFKLSFMNPIKNILISKSPVLSGTRAGVKTENLEKK
jgi:hypothetical protein